MKQRPPPLHIVQDTISQETIETLRQILLAAETGMVVGIAFAALFKNRSYTVHAAGEARRCPTFTRGMVQALDDHIAEQLTQDSQFY